MAKNRIMTKLRIEQRECNTETVEDDFENWTTVSEVNKTTHKQKENGQGVATGPSFSLGVQHMITRKVRHDDLGHRVLRGMEPRKKVRIPSFAGEPFTIMKHGRTGNEETKTKKKRKLPTYIRLTP